MTVTRTYKYSFLVGAVFFNLSTVTFASDEVPSIAIPTVNNAQIFANFTNSMPAVLNYFTSATKEQIIDFYRQSFGESISQENKRNRLTLTYAKENKVIRVVISHQNNKRQVDIIVEKAQK